jgi:predicted flavoprotein YhiN
LELVLLMTCKVAIIGGGAAGLMCAATLLESDFDGEVYVFEKNKSLGAKVIISGGGRCNVTTGIRDKKELFSKYIRGSRFLRTAIGQFPPERVYEWFEEHGVPLKIEKDGRVFPVSDDGKDVVGVFEKMFEEHNVELHFNESVVEVIPKGDDECLVFTRSAGSHSAGSHSAGSGSTTGSTTGSSVQDREYVFDTVVLCTGGNAYAHTGSTGDGYAFAKVFGHTVTKLGPSLNSFLCAEGWPKSLSGLSLPDAELCAVTDDGETVSVVGPMLFTHFGVSGPAVFALSSHLAFSEISNESPIVMSIAAVAGRSSSAWNELLRAGMEQHGAQQVLTLLKEHVPGRLAQVLCDQAEMFAGKKNSEVSKKERMKLVELLGGGLKVTFIKRRAGNEFVTAGGVKVEEIDAKTMRSKLHGSLYFAGELMDVDGVTGGFNLQASWAAGRLAGKSIAER